MSTTFIQDSGALTATAHSGRHASQPLGGSLHDCLTHRTHYVEANCVTTVFDESPFAA